MTAKKAEAKSIGRGIDDFRAAHDPDFIVPNRIREGLVKLGDSWAYEVDFLKLCALSTTQLSLYREQFEEFYVSTGGKSSKRVWAGTKGFAAKLRELAR